MKTSMKKGCAYLLTLLLAFGMVAGVTGTKTKAAGNVALTVNTNAVTDNTAANIDINFAAPNAYNTWANLKAAGLNQLEVTFKVTSFTTSSNTAGAMAFVYDKTNDDWYNGDSWVNLENNTLTSKVDLSTKLNNSGTIDHFGLQIANTSSVTYQIVSATLTSGGSGNSGNTGGSTGGLAPSNNRTYTLPSGLKDTATTTPYKEHGAIKVNMNSASDSYLQIVDQNGNPFQLRGVSTHGLNWDDVGSPYVNYDSFKNARDVLNANAVRLACYTTEYFGYADKTGAPGTQSEVQDALLYRIDAGVQLASALGMYAIVDWHILHDLTPQKYKADAKVFFDYVSKRYASQGNVVYEICNEPNGGTGWADIKSYAEEIIPIIRANDEDAIIIVGTPTWSQEVDKPAADPIKDAKGNLMANVMYTIHFYANTHGSGYRQTVIDAYKKIPIFCTEYGMCDSSGDGTNNFNEASAWLDYFDSVGISYFVWSLCQKGETASLLTSGALGSWTESNLSESGKWIKSQYATRQTKNNTTVAGSNYTIDTSSINGTYTGTGGNGEAGGNTGSGDSGSSGGTSGGSSVTKPTGGQTTGGESVGDKRTETIKNENGQDVQVSVYLSAKLKGVSNIPVGKTYTLAKKKSMTLKLVTEGATFGTPSFKSSKPKVAKISNAGKITAKKVGTTVITISYANGFTTTFTLKVVKNAVKKIKVKAKKTLKVGKTMKLKVSVSPKKKVSKKMAYKSNKPAVATVSTSGKVKALKKGTVRITVTAADGSGKKKVITIRCK